MFVPQKLIVHYHQCAVKSMGDVFIDTLNVQLFFLKSVLKCSFLQFVKESHPYNNHGPYPYAFNTLDGNVLYKEEIVDYMKSIYNFDTTDYEKYDTVINELKTILMYYLWLDEKIFNNFTRRIYRDRFFFFYYAYIIKKLKNEKLRICQLKGLDNHNFNIIRLNKLLNQIDNAMDKTKTQNKNTKVCYFDSLCFSILSIFYSIPFRLNDDLEEVLMSKPHLIEYVRNINNKYTIWENEKSFLYGVREDV